TVTPPEGAQSVETLTAIPIIATGADENYPFVNWTVSGDAEVADPDSANTTVILSGNATITANFILPIVNGTAITAISGTAGSVRQYKIAVPACPLFEIKSYGGTGDADLTVSKDGIVLQYGSGATNSETLQIENPDAGDYIISLNASSDFDSLTLLAKYYTAEPSAPTSLAASKGTYADAILVTWNESAGATSYLVYRAEIKTIPADALAETSDTSYFDNMNLEAGKTYYYWVRAKNGGDSGTSDPSAMASGNISITPVAPATVTASDGTYFDKIRVTWTKVMGATSYLVFRTDALTPAPDPANDIPLYQTTALYYDDFGDDIVPGKDDGTARKYYYWIAAKNQNAVSALKSNVGYVSKKGPAKVAASVSYTDRIIVTWNAVPGATAYDVYRYDDRAYKLGETRINGEPVEALVFEDKSPSAGNYYKVKAKYGEYYDSDPSATGAMGKIGSLAYVAATHLENGAVLPVSGVMAKGSSLYYSVEVPIGTARLVATLNGTSNAVANDCNLFAKFANFPTRTSYTAKGVENTTSEILTVSNPSPGIWYFLLYGVTDYSGVTLKVKCYSVCDIKLTQVPLNDLAVPFTATFKGMVVDESGNTGVPNIVLQVRNPITGLTSSLTKTDAKGAFTYSAAISSEGEYTFDFLFTEMIDPYKGIASHTVWTRKGCREENDYFDSSSYLAATPAVLVQADVNGMRNFLNIRNGWEYGAVDEACEAMWIEKTLASASSDASLTGKLDNGLYMLFYGVEGAGVGNDMTTASAFSAAPFVVHVEASKIDTVLSNLNALGIIDDTQKDAILAGNIGVVTVASLSSATEDIDGNMNISLMGREQLETLANLAAGLTSAEVIDYSGDTMKQVTITLSNGREINVVATVFVK
ncbi:MAG: fibronectin type III domain-containing protein, partial [Lentisphaerota bacterium]